MDVVSLLFARRISFDGGSYQTQTAASSSHGGEEGGGKPRSGMIILLSFELVGSANIRVHLMLAFRSDSHQSSLDHYFWARRDGPH